MRIAQVAPLYESVPPKLYGGTERVVSYLTEELVRQGHEVTLFASADSETRARLVEGCDTALRLRAGIVDALAHHVVMIERVAHMADEFDILHFHIDYAHFPVTRRSGWANLTTLHGRLDIADLQPLYEEFGEMPVASISDAQRAPLPHARWVGTVYHGLPSDSLVPGSGRGGYLAFLGRISPEKRVDRAIEIARRVGMPIRIAAKIDHEDRKYFEQEIAPLFDAPGVEYLGEISETDKQAFLGDAAAMLFPIDWSEPFGLVMIESMACGTPVVAWRAGSVPEIVEDGVTGFAASSIEEAVRATEQALSLDRAVCRAGFERRFTAERMAHDYVALYEALIDGDAPAADRDRAGQVV